MATQSDYVTGTITLTNGEVEFTGTGTAWLLSEFREGDFIFDIDGGDGRMGVIATIDGDAAGTLTRPWPGPDLVNVGYRLRYHNDGARMGAKAIQLTESLGNGNVSALATLTGPGVPAFNGPHSMVMLTQQELTNGANYDVQVSDPDARSVYDGQAEGFAVLISDMGDGRSAITSRVSATLGVWSDPAYVTGPIGLTPTVAVSATTLAAGSAATAVATPVTGGVSIAFGIPAGRSDGIPLTWSTATADSAPASGGIKGNNASLVSATMLFVSKTSASGSALAGFLLALDDSTNPTIKGDLTLKRVSDGASASFKVGGVTDATNYVKVAVSGHSGGSAFANGNAVSFEFSRAGDKGTDGTGTGDMVGPAGAVDGNIVVFDGTGGKNTRDGGFSIVDLIGLNLSVSQLALQVADNTNTAIFLGSSGNRVADGFDVLTYVDVAGATNLNSSVPGLLKSTSNWAGGTFLLHMDGPDASTSFTDAIGTVTATAGGDAQIDTGQSKFGGASAQFDGTGDFIYLSGGSGFTYGTGNFTIDFWVRFAATPSVVYLYDPRTTNTAKLHPLIAVIGSNLYVVVNGSNVIVGASTLGTGVWYHVALARSSGVTKLFLNGAQEGSSYTDANNYVAADANRPILGISFDGSTNGLNGWIDEFRVSKGAAQWAAAFTPPSSAYSSSPNVFSVSSATFTATSVPTKMRALLRVKEVDAAVAGLDYTLECSRDAGTSWSAMVLTELFTSPSPLASIRVVDAAETSVTGQPSGTAPRWRFKTLTGKNIELHDVYFYWS